MLITLEEYYSMGFTAADDAQAEQNIKRAGYIIDGMTCGRAITALQLNGKSAEYVKKAIAFQAQQLCDTSQESAESTEESVSLGDFSYKSSGSSTEGGSADGFSYGTHVISLLRCAGVMFGGVDV